MIVNAVRMNHKITQAAHESFVLTATIMRIIVPTQNTMNGCGITCTIARSPPPAAKVIGPPRKLFVFFETGPAASLYIWDSQSGPLRRGGRQGTDMQIISRAEAKAKGLKRYFTGKPCKHGHVAPRRVFNATCVECERAAVRKSRLKKSAAR